MKALRRVITGQIERVFWRGGLVFQLDVSPWGHNFYSFGWVFLLPLAILAAIGGIFSALMLKVAAVLMVWALAPGCVWVGPRWKTMDEVDRACAIKHEQLHWRQWLPWTAGAAGVIFAASAVIGFSPWFTAIASTVFPALYMLNIFNLKDRWEAEADTLQDDCEDRLRDVR